MKNLYYRPNPKFSNSRSQSSRHGEPRSSSGGVKLVILMLFLFVIYSIFSGADPATSGVNSYKGLSLSKADGNIRILDNDNQVLQNVSYPFEFKPGYSVLTSTKASAVLSYNGALTLRLSPSSKFSYDSIDGDSSQPELNFTLNSGQVWVSNNFAAVDSPMVKIQANYLAVDAKSSSFNLKSALPESISVLSGNLLVSILDDADKSLLDQIKLDLGKQLTLDNQSYKKFKNREIASVISTLQAALIKSAWYKWNVALDSNNVYTAFSEFEDQFKLAQGSEVRNLLSTASVDSQLPSDLENQKIEIDERKPLDPNVQPVVLLPEQGAVQTEERVILKGTVPPNTEKVMVISYDEDEPLPYVLKEFKPSAKTFKYYASYDPGVGNVLIGKNRFDIVAIFKDGSQSPKTTFEFDFADKTKLAVSNDPSQLEQQVITSPLENTSLSAVIDPQILSIKTLNGRLFEDQFELDSNRGFVQGVVSKDVKTLFVNGFKLTRFTSNSGAFHYIMSPSFGTLKQGANKLEIYGVLNNGLKTPVLRATVHYQP